jgi:hypothetical protein
MSSKKDSQALLYVLLLLLLIGGVYWWYRRRQNQEASAVEVEPGVSLPDSDVEAVNTDESGVLVLPDLN